MFQFPPLASVTYIRISVLQTDGLSHSEIPGSKVICTYPRLIAAYHVLHRLCEPRHPPCALSYFLLISSDHKNLKLKTQSLMNDNTAHTFSCISYSYFLQFCLVSICQRSLIFIIINSCEYKELRFLVYRNFKL